MYRLITKEQRTNVKDANIKHLLEKGYSREDYKSLSIFTKEEDGKFYLKAYKGTAAHPMANYYYTQQDRMIDAIAQYKRSEDNRESYKNECKANPKKSTAANCAAAIREELKSVFPGVKFSVTSSNFSMGNSVHIDWTDGPTSKQVEEITGKYQYGSFDGMTDMYENSNNRDDIPQAKYVQEQRSMSEEFKTQLFQFVPEYIKEKTDYHDNADTFIYKMWSNTPIPVGATVTGLPRTEITCGQTEDFYSVQFDKSVIVEEKTAAQPQKTIQPVEVTAGTVQIIEYSERAIAVIGDTKPIKELLKSLGGSFNPRLTCGAGWIFSKNKLEEVQTALSGGHVEEETATQEEKEPTDSRRHPEFEHAHPLNICDPTGGQYKEALNEYLPRTLEDAKKELRMK